MVSRYFGKPVYATMPMEAGGVNSMLPIAAAARLGIPMVDADGMGRAFPELQMVTFTIGGASATPMAFIDEKGNSGILDTITNKWTEDIARAATMTMGGTLTIALFCMDADTCKKYGVHGIVTRSEELGRAIRTAKEGAAAAGLTPEEYFLQFTGGHKLFKGKIVDVLRETRGAFNFGRVVLEGIGEDRGSQASVEFQNENLACTVDGEIVATVPDLICLVDPDTFTPVPTDALKYGKRRSWRRCPTSSAWWTPTRSRPCPPTRSSTASACWRWASSASICGARRRASSSWARATSASIPTTSPWKSARRGRERKCTSWALTWAERTRTPS